MKAYRAKARVITACRATIGNVVETPPEDGPGDTGNCDRPAYIQRQTGGSGATT